jgi:hypothetical protein
LRAGDNFPSDILRPILSSTLVFIGWALYASFAYTGVDFAAHLGGLAAGAIIGLASAPRIDSGKLYKSRYLLDLVKLLLVAAVLSMIGVWWAKRASASLVGDNLYHRTVHWMRHHEHTVNDAFNAALRTDRHYNAALIKSLETT